MYKVLFVPDDQRFPVEIRQAESWEDLAWMVGGSVANVDSVKDERWQHFTWRAAVNDDAVEAGMKYNSRATFLARTMGFRSDGLIHGHAVFVGPGTDAADILTADVEPVVIAEAVLLGMTIRTEEGAEVQRI